MGLFSRCDAAPSRSSPTPISRTYIVKAQVSEKDPAGLGVDPLDDARRRRRLEALSRDHREYLLDLARRLCRSHFDPDDLVQDVMETAIKEIHHLPEDANVRAWLTRVMKNRFIDRTRRR